MGCIRQTKFLFLISQPVRLVDPHLAATFSNTFKQAELWVTTELVNTSSAPATVTVRLNVSLDVDRDTCIVDHVYASEKIVIEGSSTTLFSLQPVSFSTLKLKYQNHNKSYYVCESHVNRLLCLYPNLIFFQGAALQMYLWYTLELRM